MGSLFAQRSSVEAIFKDAILHEVNNSIEVVYDIVEHGEAKPYYLVELYYSNDAGKNFIGPLKHVTGDIGDKVTPGAGKRISWNYYFEDANFTGANLVFLIKARAAAIISTKVLMGPEAAIYSVAIPGLGDTKVRAGKGYWIITAVTWGTLGAALISRSAAQSNYDKYLVANSVSEANSSFEKAERQFATYRILRSTALVLWTVDVAGVFIRGSKNRKERSAARSKIDVGVNWTRLPSGTPPCALVAFRF